MKTKEEIYEAWAEKDVSRKGALQREAFMAGWKEAVEVCVEVVRISYVIDESEDFVAVAIQNIRSATK
jgi:hypothetical protein